MKLLKFHIPLVVCYQGLIMLWNGALKLWRWEILCLKAEGDYVWYKSDELDANYVMLIMGKEVCTDVCSILMCKYTCVLDLVNMG